ncbi:hypothetical protein ACWS7L_09455 [Exiguobacterium artemiae]|uniref:hypothetical protein n=1 Tax=Exiguobacterium sp. S22-S28 TaxID=3342768 RepID=UPI00372D8119
MSKRMKDYGISFIILGIAVILIGVLDLPKGISAVAVILVVVLSVFLYEFRRFLNQDARK